jgi:hypothetical protein
MGIGILQDKQTLESELLCVSPALAAVGAGSQSWLWLAGAKVPRFDDHPTPINVSVRPILGGEKTAGGLKRLCRTCKAAEKCRLLTMETALLRVCLFDMAENTTDSNDGGGAQTTQCCCVIC